MGVSQASGIAERPVAPIAPAMTWSDRRREMLLIVPFAVPLRNAVYRDGVYVTRPCQPFGSALLETPHLQLKLIHTFLIHASY
jgi:hypothetical protein